MPKKSPSKKQKKSDYGAEHVYNAKNKNKQSKHITQIFSSLTEIKLSWFLSPEHPAKVIKQVKAKVADLLNSID